MRFRLDYTPPESAQKIGHTNNILLAGSCFAENIGNKLKDHRFRCIVNPGGIHFDPLTMCSFLNAALSDKIPAKEDFIERSGQFFSYGFHSSVNAPSREQLVAKISSIYSTTRESLTQADFIFLSFGTAFVHHLNAGVKAVANCHKQPAQLFTKKLITYEELISSCSELFSKIRAANKNVRIILTVSPVKYLRDGPINNNVSKATLLLLSHHLAASENCIYFPAFELVNDDLRDYRFYKDDLAHPNDLAVAYIWEKFSKTFFSSLTREVVAEIESLNRSLAHRSIHSLAAEEEALKASIQRQKERILSLDPSVLL
jgi:hypothetical protein